MAFSVCCVCYPRSNHFRKRLLSIGPRFNRIIGAEFLTENLRKTNADKKTIDELNKKLTDFTQRECVHVVLIGENSTRDLIPASHLVVKSVSDVTFTVDVKHPAVYVIVVEMYPENEKKFDEDLHTRMSEVPKSERKYVVIVIIPTEECKHDTMVETAKRHTQFLGELDCNFEFDKCVVIMPAKSLLKEHVLKENKPVTREAAKRESSMSPTSPYKTKVPSPPKRTFNLAETAKYANIPATRTQENPVESGSEYKTNAANEVSDSKDNKVKYDEKAIGKAISNQLESKGIDILEELENFLHHLKSRRDGCAGSSLFTDLDKMLYEFKGLYNVSESKKGRERKFAEKEINGKLPEQMSADLLELDHVRGCGRIYGALNVHVEADVDVDQQEVAKQAIKTVITRHGYKLPYQVRFITSKMSKMSIRRNSSYLLNSNHFIDKCYSVGCNRFSIK